MRRHLFTPGPVPLDPHVQLAMAEPVAGHRSSEFSALLSRLQNRLTDLLRSEGPVPLFPGSGTAALEALAVNFTGRGSKVISVSCGVFGDRFREMARRQGAEIIPFDVEPGGACRPEAVADACRGHPDADALLLTHSETSTGVLNPLEEICKALPEKKPLLLVDAVSSLGVVPLHPGKWGVDGIASCSQKGLAAPPGLGIVWLSGRARNALCTGVTPRTVYFDLPELLSGFQEERPSIPYTPPVTLLRALDAALDLMAREGCERHFAARKRFARLLADGLDSMGLELLAGEERHRSPGVTAVKIPEGRAGEVREALREMGLETAGGQNGLKGHVVRIGHFTNEGWPEACLLLGSLWAACRKAGIALDKPDLSRCYKVFREEDEPCGRYW